MTQIILVNDETKEYTVIVPAKFMIGWRPDIRQPSELVRDGYNWINVYEMVDNARAGKYPKK